MAGELTTRGLARGLGIVLGQGGVADGLRKSTAQKIIAAAMAFTTRGIMGSAPVMTVGPANGNSQIPGNTYGPGFPQFLLNDPLIRRSGPVRLQTAGNQYNGFLGAWSTRSDGLYDGGDGWGIGIKTNSRYAELNVNRIGVDELIRVRVDGLWAQVADYTAFSDGSDFSPHQVMFDFGTTATRTIEFFFENVADIIGLNLVPGATLALPDTGLGDVTATAFTDSYGGGRTPGLSNIRNTVWQAFGELMGVKDIHVHGRGGQGYVAQVDSLTINQRIALDAGRTDTPDIVFLHGSVNDASQSASAAQANVTDGIRKARAAYPSGWIAFFTGFRSGANPTDLAHFAAYKAGADAVAAGDKGVLVIDTSDFPTVTNTGTMPNGAANDSADNNHAGPNQTANFASMMKSRTIEYLRASVAGRYTPLSLNAKLLEWWSPEATELMTLVGSQVSSWRGVKNNFNALQATSTARPIYQPSALGSGLPCLSFDGVDDYLQVANHNLPSGTAAFEVWAVIRCDTADTTTTRDPIVYGAGASSAMYRMQRTGSGVLQSATSGVFASGPANIVQGTSFLVRSIVTGTTVQTFVNGVGGSILAASIAITNGPMSLGSTPNGGGSFWAGDIGDMLFTAPLSAQEAADLEAFLLGRK